MKHFNAKSEMLTSLVG